MVSTDFKLRYQGSILGYMWTLLKPLLMFTILYLVFVRLLRISANVPNPAIYLLFGLVIWYFFGEVTSTGLSSLVGRADLLRKIHFPRYVVVLSVTGSALISFGLNMVVIVLFMILAQVPVGPQILWLIPLFIELLVLSIACAFFLSGLYVRYRDVSYIWEVVLQAAFYATPILYPLSLLPTRYAKLALLNPMAQIIQDARWALVTTQTQTMSQLYGSFWARLIPIGIVLVLAIGSVWYFRRRSPTFAEEA